jgi:tRNA pseudouridine55 synthase
MFGFLNLRKPAGCTSRDVVNRIQKLVRPEKVGHAGTLDPLATGVLVVALGNATRLVEYVQQQPKSYRATFLLGRHSDTEDIEGKVVELASPRVPTSTELLAVIPKFLGEIDQVPPAYSALKVSGRRAYALARRGEEVKLEARKITIHSLQVTDYTYPALQLDIACSSGTYVRSLGRDLARALGTEAVMSALDRTHIGSFTADDAFDPEEVTRNNVLHLLEPARAAVRHLPELSLEHGEVTELLHGRPVQRRREEVASIAAGAELAGFDPAGELVAILTPREGALWPTRVFVSH